MMASVNEHQHDKQDSPTKQKLPRSSSASVPESSLAKKDLKGTQDLQEQPDLPQWLSTSDKSDASDPEFSPVDKDSEVMQNSRTHQELQHSLSASESELSPADEDFQDVQESKSQPILQQSLPTSGSEIPPTTFPLFSKLPPEIRIKIWELISPPGRLIKVSPVDWNPSLECRYVVRPRKSGREGNRIRLCCISHERRNRPIPDQICFEAHQIVFKHVHLEPMALGGYSTSSQPISVQYENDTILLMTHCSLRPEINRWGILALGCRGFARSLVNSGDWHKIQHLAMELKTLSYSSPLTSPPIYEDTFMAFARDILKMKSLKTFTVIAAYVRYESRGPADTLVDLEQCKTETQNPAKDSNNIPKSLREKYETRLSDIRAHWDYAIKQLLLRSPEPHHKIPQLRVRILKMNDGHQIQDSR